MPDATVLFQHLGLSLALGLLVGLQRERAGSGLAGFRTYPLITVLGTMCAALGEVYGGWVVPVGLLGVVGVVLVGNLSDERRKQENLGTTSEFAVLLMFAVGAFVHVGPWIVAVAVGAGVAVLLQFKPQLHGLARRLSDDDVSAVMRFVLITCVVLPVLPDRPLTEKSPFSALNPFEIWLMVVLIVGISLGGYVCYRLFGQRAGVLLSGILGGAISARRPRPAMPAAATAQTTAPLAALVIAIAAVVVVGRVLGEIAVVSPRLFAVAAPPLAIVAVAGLAPLVFVWLRNDQDSIALPEQKNPTEIKSALAFAALYALVKLSLAAAHQYLHVEGVYLVAVLSGLTDMDAITLSTARLFEADKLAAGVAWRLVLTAGVANLAFKAGIVATLGGRRLLRIVAALFAPPAVAALLLIWLWR